MTATIRISAVTSNGSSCTVKSDFPKSATLPKTSALPTGPRFEPVTGNAARLSTERENAYARKPSPTNASTMAGTVIFGKRLGPCANGATPLLSSAITNTNSTRMAPEYTMICITARNSAFSVRYSAASAAKFAAARRRSTPVSWR